MTGHTPDGEATAFHRRESRRPVPSGPLTKTQVVDIQSVIARGLAANGYTDEQIGQIFNRSERTATRRSQGARPHTLSKPFSRHVRPYV